ncbi:prealbumin-like fold domain-containing protein [Psychrobacter aquimaris]|uniref:prealbumin-like fold domain-containing protein n=1 Tax=Psychrobacter aquimaris TaxID=292733 RepID=UPI003FD2E90C
MHKMPYVLNSIISQLFSKYIYHVLALIATMGLILVSNEAFAADPNPFESSPSSDLASCPVNHKMYYIGANAPISTTSKPVISQALNWTSGSDNRTFTFTEGSGNKEFVINFPILLDLNTNYGGTPPFFGSINGATTSALNLVHNSPSIKNNHSLNVSINRSVSKVGYKIQDLDSTSTTGQIPYIEQVDVSANQGQLTFNTNFHTRNATNNIVTARSGLNCGTGGCTIDAAWNYNISNIALNLKHNNTFTQTNSPHAIGYSDFYFCLAPPKLIVKKALNGARINDTNTKRDQFEIKVTGGSIAANNFTTTGTGSNITDGTSSLLSLAEGNSYTITERVMNGTTLGEIANYNATYVCTNATTGSTSIMPSGNASSFTLSGLNYGDEITCTITNTPKTYSFSGVVFNDNGKITSPTKDDISDKYLNNRLYFNGKYDSPTESGIPFTTGHTITLNKCAGDTGTFTSQTMNINPDGTYSFTLTPAQLGSNTRLCATQNEPNNYTYSVDTTSNVRQINITNNTFNYPDNNFGDVIQDNAALVLFKSQYVHDCNLTDLTTISVNYTGSANTVYSTNPISNIIPGQCIAYRIEAVNRGNVPLTDIIIRDTLQKKGENGALVTSTLATPTPIGENSGIPSFSSSSVSIGNNGLVLTNGFPLGITSSDRSRAIRFNTKYGTTITP